MEIFGPVPSRRLGISLGINNIPHKVCSYSCLYCQVGKGVTIEVERQEFYKPGFLVEKVRETLSKIKNNKEFPDYLTIVPDGEPTLDINLGTLINSLKTFNIPIAVITNATLLSLPEVRAELNAADYVSVKCDTFNENVWRKINIPHKSLDLQTILKGTQQFAKEFRGKLVTETMLLKGVNDKADDLTKTAEIISTLNSDTSFISIPTRPTAFRKADKPDKPDEQTLTMAYDIFSERIENVELLTGYEGDAFASSGNFSEDVLSITAVHPMREDAVRKLLEKSGGTLDELSDLVKQKLLERVNYRGENFYLRKFRRS
jgi:wyosine [tRNA(Phe)-imidazoG37] synthetase (radical SAM superfamily)